MSDNLTLDELKLFDLKLFQPRTGYRYSLDPLLLTKFCTPVKHGGMIVDLGSGCGIIALVLARVNDGTLLSAVEKNPDMARLVAKNAYENKLADRVRVVEADVLDIKAYSQDSLFDLVVCNPPFRASGSGKISPKNGRDMARHETTATMADFISAAKYLVKPSGKICFIQLPSRLQEFMSIASELKLSVLRIRMVHNNSQSGATMFMAELAKGRRTAPVIEPPLFVRDMSGEFTDEVWR